MKKEQKLIFRLLPLLIAAVIAALLPQMIRNEYYMTIACQILIYLIAVCGLNFITGLTGQMNLGTAGMFAMGAYVSGLLNVKLGVSPWLGLVAALCVGWLIGKALGYPSLRLRGVYLSLTTIAFTEIIRMLLNNMKGVKRCTGPARHRALQFLRLSDRGHDSVLLYGAHRGHSCGMVRLAHRQFQVGPRVQGRARQH